VDDRILAEYADVLRRPEMRPYFSAADADSIIDLLDHNAEHALATVCIAGLPDTDDAPFLEVALAASVPLVTGNERHFPTERRSGCVVLNPADFIARWATRAPSPP
jgi:predicted nucleic acid-binding protein